MQSADNPYTDLIGSSVMGELMNPNPYINPADMTGYGGGLAMPGYSLAAGPPTDSSGKPIQSFLTAQNQGQAAVAAQNAAALAQYNQSQQGQPAQSPQTQPGTTLNSSPVSMAQSTMYPASVNQPAGNLYDPNARIGPGAAYAAATGQAAPGALNWQQIQSANAGNADIQAGLSGMQNGQGGNAALGSAMGYAAQQNYNNAQQQPSASAASGPPTPATWDSRQAYLSALANPGNPTTPGAAPPQAGQSLTGSTPVPSVLRSFLAQNPGGSIPGGYSNQNIFNALNLVGSAGGGGAPAAGGGTGIPAGYQPGQAAPKPQQQGAVA